MKNNLINEDYKDFIGDIKNKIRNSQYEAMKAVNTALINLYWGIGQEIYKQQRERGWGKSIVEAYKKNMFALLGKPGYESEKDALEARLK